MKDMTVGNVRKHIVEFAFPLFIGNLLQLANTIVDRIWAGKFIGTNALGAVSICFSVFFIMISISIALSQASSIMISQFFGAKKHERLKDVVGNSFILIAITSLVSTLCIQFFVDNILSWIKTPPDLFDYARDYLSMLSMGFIFVMAFNVLNAFFRAIGNSMVPLKFLAVSVGINIVLDPLLMLGIGPFPRMELKGAALATIIAQFIAFFAGFFYMQSKEDIIAVRAFHLKPKKDIISKMFKLAIPGSVRFGLLSVGITVVQATINKFGAAAAAAYGAASNVDTIAFYPTMSISAAVSTIVGQNIGARKIDRAKETMKQGLIITLSIISIITLLAFIFPRFFLLLFVNRGDTEVIRLGCDYLRIIAFPYLFIMSVLIILGLIEGAGDTMATMVLSIINLWIVRVPLVIVLSNTWGLNGLWFGIGIAFVIDFCVTFSYYKIGIWKRKAVV